MLSFFMCRLDWETQCVIGRLGLLLAFVYFGFLVFYTLIYLVHRKKELFRLSGILRGIYLIQSYI